jgi:hypothetical protein
MARRQLQDACDAAGLFHHLSEEFVRRPRACRHDFALTQAYFARDARQASRIIALLQELGVQCDCEAYFALRAHVVPPLSSSYVPLATNA